jgi:hypothetical protein
VTTNNESAWLMGGKGDGNGDKGGGRLTAMMGKKRAMVTRAVGNEECNRD